MDRYSNGSYVVKDKVIDSYMVSEFVNSDNIDKDYGVGNTTIKKKEDEGKSLKEIDDRIMTIDDLLDNIEGK
jgi:hypothetical protein